MNATTNAILERLNIESHGLSRVEREVVLRIAQQLVERLTCEQWGHERGWHIPPFNSPAWHELRAAWLDSEDDEVSPEAAYFPRPGETQRRLEQRRPR